MDKPYELSAEEEAYRAIGRFIYEFSQAESTIRDCVSDSIGLDYKYHSDIIESYDVAMLCNIAISVFEKSLPRYQVRKLKPLINKFRELNNVRVRVAHGVWVPSIDGGTVHHTSRRGLKSIASANQAASLERLADEACDLRAEIERTFLPLPGDEQLDPSDYEIGK
jgi:hypothetical protein